MKAVDRPHFSPWLLWDAEHQANLAREIEDAPLPKARAVWIEHRAYILSSIVAAAAFVEAFINEVHQDVDDRARRRMHPADWLDQITRLVSARVQDQMRAYWEATHGGHRPTIEKYERFSGLCGSELHGDIRDDVRLLTDLRNEILHYRPADHFTARKAHTLNRNQEAEGSGESAGRRI